MKRRFEFRLERVTRIRGLEERVARAERASAETQAQRAEERRDQARSVLERSRSWLRAALQGRIDPRAVLASQRALDAEQRRLERSLESARTLRTQAERMAAAHRARRSAARALEELRARTRIRHRSALEKEDNAALDEIAVQRARSTRPPAGMRETDSRSPAQGSDQDSTPEQESA